MVVLLKETPTRAGSDPTPGLRPLVGPFLPSLSCLPAASPPTSVVSFFLPTGASHHP